MLRRAFRPVSKYEVAPALMPTNLEKL